MRIIAMMVLPSASKVKSFSFGPSSEDVKSLALAMIDAKFQVRESVLVNASTLVAYGPFLPQYLRTAGAHVGRTDGIKHYHDILGVRPVINVHDCRLDVCAVFELHSPAATGHAERAAAEVFLAGHAVGKPSKREHSCLLAYGHGLRCAVLRCVESRR